MKLIAGHLNRITGDGQLLLGFYAGLLWKVKSKRRGFGDGFTQDGEIPIRSEAEQQGRGGRRGREGGTGQPRERWGSDRAQPRSDVRRDSSARLRNVRGSRGCAWRRPRRLVRSGERPESERRVEVIVRAGSTSNFIP